MGDEIGGHHVSGHVHTTAQIRQIQDTENNRRLTFQVRGAQHLPVFHVHCVYYCAMHHMLLGACKIGSSIMKQFVAITHDHRQIYMSAVSLACAYCRCPRSGSSTFFQKDSLLLMGAASR